MMLGYILYPALIFSFAALMITTFDSVFYGQTVNSDCLKTANCTIDDICGKDKSVNDSIYCVIAKTVDTNNIKPNMCNVSAGKMLNAITSDYPIKLFNISIFTTKSVRDNIFSTIFSAMLKMMMFAILFHHLTTAVISFLESLLGVYGIAGTTPSHNALGRAMGKAAFAGVTAPISIFKGGAAAAKGAAKFASSVGNVARGKISSDK